MYYIPDSISQNEKKKNSTERCLKFLTPPRAQIYYCASSLRNHGLFLIPHLELWNLSPAQLAPNVQSSLLELGAQTDRAESKTINQNDTFSITLMMMRNKQ